MLTHYVEIMFMCIGIYIIALPHFSPWVGYVAGAFMIVLSIIKIFGA